MNPNALEPRFAKKNLRIFMRQVLASLSAELRLEASAMVCERLLQMRVWNIARAVMCYAPMPGELDIAPLVTRALDEGKLVALPQYVPEQQFYRAAILETPLEKLPAGAFGIREPGCHSKAIELNQLDLILVPGLAFGVSGQRLGRGKGFYDRLLSGVERTKCGVAFDEQIRSHIPVEPHDIVVDCVVTPGRSLVCRPNGN
jgi:5-formyltetrahydrofolate cyclo-ligase